mmetsp:Transcript_126665/g.316578  ORF Transcript_126665/g.316578 Transcript_126665/m.316578 type:complete len:259 (+) Transcript_126665:1-777(+)
MVASGCRDGGAFSFLTEGLRCSSIHWSIYTAARDVSLNLCITIFAGRGVQQLLACSGILAFYSLATFQQMPFEALSLNFVEVWTSAGLMAFLNFTAAFGFQGSAMNLKALSESTLSGDIDYNSRAMWLVSILILSVGVPILLMVFEVACMAPAIVPMMPRWLQPVSKDELSAHKAKAREWLRNIDLGHVVASMDNVELRRFLFSVNGSPYCEALEKAAKPRRRLTLQNSTLAQVSQRSSLIESTNVLAMSGRKQSVVV